MYDKFHLDYFFITSKIIKEEIGNSYKLFMFTHNQYIHIGIML